MADETEASPSPEPAARILSRGGYSTLQTSVMGEDSSLCPQRQCSVHAPKITGATGLMMCHANSTVMLIEGTCERALEFLLHAVRYGGENMPAKVCRRRIVCPGAPSRVYTKWSMRTVSAKKEGGVELQDNIVDEQEEVYMNLINLGMSFPKQRTRTATTRRPWTTWRQNLSASLRPESAWKQSQLATKS